MKADMINSPGIVLDNDRERRIGIDEAILCEQKTVRQIIEIAEMCEGEPRLFTRLAAEKYDALPSKIQSKLDYSEEARTAVLGTRHAMSDQVRVGIVSAGSSDAPTVAEARETLNYYGQPVNVISDVGVAGIWRLMDRIDEISRAQVVIAVAGMDAALPTVLSGLIPSIVIGVPTSTGYGAARNGETALCAMLSSCAPGMTVTNIDNGYGAACAALKIARAISK